MIITVEFKAEVQTLRAEGWTWPEIAEILGCAQRTCQRALAVQRQKKCARCDCDEQAVSNGKFCVEHGRAAMNNRAGEGTNQRQVLRLLKRHGLLTTEQLRNLTSLNSDSLGQVMTRLVKLGLVERPIRSYYRLPHN